MLKSHEKQRRLLGLFLLLAIGFLSSCAADTNDVEALVGVALLAILFFLTFLVLFFFGLYRGLRKKRWGTFSVACGFFTGTLISMATMLNVSEEAQYMVIGGFLGMGTDWAATLGSPSGPKTAIHSLATLISETRDAILKAAVQTDVKPGYAINITIFLYTTVLVVLLMLLIAKALGPIFLGLN